MTSSNLQKTIIGRAEYVRLLDHSEQHIPAKVDTGADLSSIWATRVKEKDDRLAFTLFGPKSEFYTGQIITLPKAEYKLAKIANSFGDKEWRYIVKLRILVNGRTVKANFSLANRSRKTYPILLGRRLLHKKFLVDVTEGRALKQWEQHRKLLLRKKFNKRLV